MRIVELDPVMLPDSASAPLEKELWAFLDEVIYGPVIAMIEAHGIPFPRGRVSLKARKNDVMETAAVIVAAALSAGALVYAKGFFTGDFNARISRALRGIGAEKTTRGGKPAFKAGRSGLPVPVSAAIAAATVMKEGLRAALNRLLSAMTEGLEKAGTGVGTKSFASAVAGRLDTGIKAGIARASASAGIPNIPYIITPGIRDALNRELTENAELAIKGFAKERIPALRRMVEESAVEGFRASGLTSMIQAEIGIGRRRAAFIARQETSLFVSKYKEQKYRGMGCVRYRWLTSNDERVRKDHQALNNKIFSYDDPPIVNRSTGNRANPGEDFNCRCVASPVLVYGGVSDEDDDGVKGGVA